MLWIESSLDNILKEAAKETQTDKENTYTSKLYCLNVKYRFKNSLDKDWLALHSSDKDDDKITVPLTEKEKKLSTDDQKNPFRQKTPSETQETKDQDCLIRFPIWQEKDVLTILPDSVNTVTAEFDQIKNEFEDAILNTNNKKECEKNSGIYLNDTCHYYEVLKRLCLKIDFDENDKGIPTEALFDSGCFASQEPTFFKTAKVGAYYNFARR